MTPDAYGDLAATGPCILDGIDDQDILARGERFSKGFVSGSFDTGDQTAKFEFKRNGLITRLRSSNCDQRGCSEMLNGNFEVLKISLRYGKIGL